MVTIYSAFTTTNRLNVSLNVSLSQPYPSIWRLQTKEIAKTD